MCDKIKIKFDSIQIVIGKKESTMRLKQEGNVLYEDTISMVLSNKDSITMEGLDGYILVPMIRK